MRGLERRVEAGLNPDVASVASVFISRWDAAVIETVPDELRDKLGLAVGRRTYAAYRELLDSDRAMRLRNEGAQAAAPALGEHRDQGPRRLRRPLHRGPGVARSRSTRCPRRRCRRSPTTARSASTLPLDGGDAERDAEGVQRRRHRHRRARHQAPGGRRAGVRGLLERAARHDRLAAALRCLRIAAVRSGERAEHGYRVS